MAHIVSVNAQPSGEPTLPRIRLTDSVECTSVKDQGGSPTCWVFGTNSLFESDLIHQYGIRLNLSEMFIARYAYIDKARRFLETGGKTYFEGGGQFHDVIRVIKRYGIAPEEAYNGRPDKKLTHEHSGLDTAMKIFTHRLLKEDKKDLNNDDLRQMNDTLDKYLGKVPVSFVYKEKVYTPASFAKEVVRFADDYVQLVSFADKLLYKQFILADKYNWANDSFWNITLADMQMLVDTALHKGWSVGWEGDVTDAGFDFWGGYALLPEPIATGSAYNYDELRLVNYQTEITERDHMLQVAGAGRDEKGKKWYYMKNSWGSSYFSKYKGYLYMEENYFRMKTVIMLVNKEALPESLKEKLNIR
ncbi:MAG: C1 family peptidase [Bacteroidota bacterium]